MLCHKSSPRARETPEWAISQTAIPGEGEGLIRNYVGGRSLRWSFSTMASMIQRWREVLMPFALFFLLRRARHLQIIMLER
jgi:hypothetical protein